MASRKISIVCNSPAFCDSISKLNSPDTDTIIYFSYFDLLESSEQYDSVIITDDLAPGENPFEAIKQVKDKFPDVPVIFLGFDEKTVKRAQFYGADSSYTLPVFQFTPGEIVERAIARFKQKQLAQKPSFREERTEKPTDWNRLKSFR